MANFQATKPTIDYSLYLVTGRNYLPPGKTYLQSLEEAIQGGVTLVQVREKDAETADFLEIALQTVALCRKHQIPVLINDRIDIALASNADGVHLGQEDMSIAVARKLLPPNAVIGKSCKSLEHVREAIKEKVDYVGLGAVYTTNTKDVSAPGKVIGVKGLRSILAELEGAGMPAVAIGGIKSNNLLRVLHGGVAPSGHGLHGVAVVSEIMASTEPRAASERLARIIRSWSASPRVPASFSSFEASMYTAQRVVDSAAKLLAQVRELKPLVHQITNNVVKAQSANATIALGGSPIMAAAAEEQADLARIPGGLLINFGTVEDMDGMLAAGLNANLNRKPVVFDPVGVGATTYRQTCAHVQLLNTWQPAVIKGNAAEIGAIVNSDEVKSQGVDSLGSGFKDPAAVVRLLSKQERCISVLSGPTDYISDGSTVIRLSNGHPLLGQITGAGCMLGTAIATFCGAASIAAERAAPGDAYGSLVRGDMLTAAAAGVLALTVASEIAAQRSDVRGPGTFLPALIDELANLTPEVIRQRAKVEVDDE
ncbi:hypothetical protein EWM64_g3030 [Hericium alpestre]|uniref:Thiamine phosphate synthase/TenI domain-containing protein n=1 Tax=Hericium alpestre TaxID=135208 RepID=A0A4Z0A4Z0_9AGAM|nr:hypothetical protein EWM64_g3030 [Hericium alpestre]